MRLNPKVLLSLGGGFVMYGTFAACTAGTGLTVSKNDPNYDSFHEGYNYANGKGYLCSYVDATVVRTVGAEPSYTSQVRRTDVIPGVHDTSRAAIIASAKALAVSGLRSSVPQIRQIRSCDLECEEIKDGPRGYGNADAGVAYDDSAEQPTPGKSASQASTTNNQVEGVDEADFIKNDNKYIYIVANGSLKIIDAYPGNAAKTLASVALTKGTPTKLLLGTDRLVVYSSVGGSSTSSTNRGECTYGYQCVPTGDGSATHITVFDITNRAAPAILRELDLSGSLIAARRIGDAVHSVIYDAPFEEKLRTLQQAPYLPERCYDVRDDVEKVAADLARVVDDKIAQIMALSDAGPSLKDGAAAIEPTFRASNLAGNSFVSIASFGISGAGLKAETVYGKPGFVYASSSALYMSIPHSQTEGDWYGGNYSASASEVYKFAIGASPSQTSYQASGIVKGTVLNQFAMDEWGGNLRIATTSGRAPDPSVHSTVTILQQTGGGLAQRGIVDNIAPTEDIRSVRFDGDRGFLVTFKKTDPLFALDLANPVAPKVTGELKIPGFSTYMHIMDKTHILALGLEADDQGSYAYFNGVQVQIFDIANMASPKLVHKTVIGTRGTNSEALTNHLGFNYFAPKNLLALPMTICEGGGNGQFGDTMTFNGLLVFDASVAGGIAKRGGVAHEVGEGVSCNNWWTDPSTNVKRSVIMDDFVYSVAEDTIDIASLSNLAAAPSSISLK